MLLNEEFDVVVFRRAGRLGRGRLRGGPFALISLPQSQVFLFQGIETAL
jgi:hypothetical protein